jgi:hypothetical protein
MSDQLPGIPAGYEAVRFGTPKDGDCYVDIHGKVVTTESGFLHGHYLIVRKISPKSRTVEVAEFATWWLDSPDAVRVKVMSQSMVDQLVAAKTARRISDWREIEIWEDDQ